jgi:hypothetical protein
VPAPTLDLDPAVAVDAHTRLLEKALAGRLGARFTPTLAYG